jgi:hypothetical protein
MKFRAIILTAMATAVATLTHAQNGTIGLTDVGTPTDNSPSDVSLATSFTIADLNSFANNTGVFFGLAAQNFGSLSFSLSSPAGLSFGTPVFGSFTCTGISILDSQTGHGIELRASGFYSSGTFDGGVINNESASIDLGFTQNGAGLADSAVFSIPAVPEPGSLALLGVGATALGLHLRRRKA